MRINRTNAFGELRNDVPPAGPDRDAAMCRSTGGRADDLRRAAWIGCGEIAVADTIGHGTPDRVGRMLDEVLDAVPVARLACHFHDTSGLALANTDVALDRGVRVFDSAAGGLGGCPYAPGAAGNVATGRVLSHLAAAGYATGVDMAALAGAEDYAAGLRQPFASSSGKGRHAQRT
jgi:hydroxymethylglutaryl-CoA lyase